MKRQTAIKYIMAAIAESDIVIFSGKDMCEEGNAYDRPGNFYVDDYFGLSVSLGLGMALNTDKRVFIFVGEGDLIRELAAVAQVAVSKLRNIFIIVLDNGIYQAAGNYPNIFEGVLSKKGILYNTGCKVFDLTWHINKKITTQVTATIDRIKGPMVILVTVTKGLSKNSIKLDIDKIKHKDRLVSLLQDTTMTTALFNTPLFTFKEDVTNSLDLSKTNFGGTE